MEYELLDTGVFNEDRYFDVFVEYAKQSPEDLLIQISVSNRGPEPATIACPADAVVSQHLDMVARYAEAVLEAGLGSERRSGIAASHADLGERYLYCEGDVPLLFTENETNNERLFGTPNHSPLRQRRNQQLRSRRKSQRGQSRRKREPNPRHTIS